MRHHKPPSILRRTWLWLGYSVGGLWALAGCLTMDQMAPPVGPEFVPDQSNGVMLALLRQGRDVYLSDCTRCHAVEPIDRYSQKRWRAIINRMGKRSKLDDSRVTALRAYVLAAHSVLRGQAANKWRGGKSADSP